MYPARDTLQHLIKAWWKVAWQKAGKTLPVFFLLNRGVHAHSCIMGNQGKMAENSKICIGIQSQLIVPEFIYWCFLFEKSNLRVQLKQYTKSGVQRSQWSILDNLDFPDTFSVILILSNYRIENVWENQGFLTTDHGLLCTNSTRLLKMKTKLKIRCFYK